MTTMSTGTTRGTRAFVMLIVLAVVGLLALAVAARYAAMSSTGRVVARVNEEERARQAAEACLSLLSAYAEEYAKKNPTGRNTHWDWDALLDPNRPAYQDAAPDGDEFVMPGLPIVTVPRSATGASAMLHRFNIVDVGEGARCLARLDDNSDESLDEYMGTFLRACSPDAGVSDNPLADCDGTIVLTAIGLYPVFAGTPDAEAYERAHARVTARRLFAHAAVNTQGATFDTDLFDFRSGVSLVSNTRVSLVGRTDVCGQGGVHTPVLETTSGSCVCGQIVAGNISGPTPPDTGCACSPCNPTSFELGAAPPRSVHAYLAPEPDLDRREWMVSDPSTTCEVFLDDKVAFVWDWQDDDAKDQGPATASCAPGSTCENGTHRCASPGDLPGQNPQRVLRPCRWQLAGNSMTPTSIVCSAGETPCWKPVAALGTGAPRAGEHAVDHDGTRWLAFRTGALPNVKGGRGIAGASGRVCGGAPITTPGDPVVGCHDAACARYDTARDLQRGTLPSGLLVFADRDVRVRDTGGSDLLPLGVVAFGDVRVDDHVALGGAELGEVVPRHAEDCGFGFGFGAAVVATGDCVIGSVDDVRGTVECRSVDLVGGGGYESVTGHEERVTCGARPSAVCMRPNTCVQDVTSWGDLVSLGPTRLELFANVDGDVLVRGALVGKSINSAVIMASGEIVLVNSDDYVSGPYGFTIKQSATYQETTW